MLDVAEEEGMELEEDDLIQIAEEAQLIQEERIIEDWNTVPIAGRNGKRRGDMEESVRDVEELMLAMNLDKPEKEDKQSENRWEVKQGRFLM